MVKTEFAALAVVEAKQDLLSDLRCRDCVLCPRQPRTISALLSCDGCYDSFRDNEGVSQLLHLREEELDSLLMRYNLSLPFNALVTREAWYCDEDALSALAFSLPSTTSSSKLPYISPEGHEMDAHVGHEVTPFDPSLITSLPSFAPARLRSFVRLFHLEVVDPSSYLKSTDSETNELTGDREKVKVEPRWQLWGSATCC